ncbi:MAG: ABC transporter substrate-binding protein [Lachnospiraceae bacterium]
MKKRILALMTVVILMITSLFACAPKEKVTNSNETKEKKEVKITLNEVAHSIFYAPMYVAIEEGYFAKEGIDVNLVTGFGADKTMTAVLSAEADIGFMGAESTIYTYQEGLKDPVVNFAQLTQRAGNFLVAREKMPEFSWDDLKGKEVIGGRKGGMPEMVFEYILKQNHITPFTDVTINQGIDFGSTAAAFSGGQGDFTIEFEPAATKLEQEGVGTVVASLGVDSGYVPYTSFCAKSSYIKDHPELIQSFTNALQKGMEYTKNHSPEEIAAIIAPQFAETDRKTLTQIVSRYYQQETWNDDLIFEKKSFELLQDILESAGELQERVAYEDLVTTEYAKESVK